MTFESDDVVPALPKPQAHYVEKLRALQTEMRDRLLEQLGAQENAANESYLATETSLADVEDTRGGDTIYRIDVRGEEILFAFCDAWARDENTTFALIAEGIGDDAGGWRIFPDGASETDAIFLLIVDPIDGTRNIMYNKRSAWILSGIAPNTRGRETTLADIAVACMTEIPTTRQYLSDQLWATEDDRDAHREAHNLLDGTVQTLSIRPSRALNLSHGFASLSKFFPTAKGITAQLEEELLAAVAPNAGENPLVFDDQYISTGGQLYELMVGHDRFLADVRPILHSAIGAPSKLVCHPYDICVELIARKAGIIVTDATNGRPLFTPLDIHAPVAWAGYANSAICALVEPELNRLLVQWRKKNGEI